MSQASLALSTFFKWAGTGARLPQRPEDLPSDPAGSRTPAPPPFPRQPWSAWSLFPPPVRPNVVPRSSQGGSRHGLGSFGGRSCWKQGAPVRLREPPPPIMAALRALPLQPLPAPSPRYYFPRRFSWPGRLLRAKLLTAPQLRDTGLTRIPHYVCVPTPDFFYTLIIASSAGFPFGEKQVH